MNIHILCLNAFVLLMTLNPVSIAELVKMSLRSRGIPLSKDAYLMMLAMTYLILFGGVLLVDRRVYQLGFPSESLWYLWAVIAGPLIIVGEILIVVIFFVIKGRERPSFKMSKMGEDQIVAGLSVVAVGILEEAIYRQVWMTIFISWGMSIYLAIFISALFYAFNHITLGPYVFCQKLFAGLIFGLLYYVSGYAVIIPMIAHGVQNIIVVVRGE